MRRGAFTVAPDHLLGSPGRSEVQPGELIGSAKLHIAGKSDEHHQLHHIPDLGLSVEPIGADVDVAEAIDSSDVVDALTPSLAAGIPDRLADEDAHRDMVPDPSFHGSPGTQVMCG